MRKFRGKRGFTLTEMLISVLLLGFVTVMVTVMTSTVLSTTSTMQNVAQAEILGSEALENVQGQLRVALNVKVSTGGEILFDLDSANKNYTFGLEDGKITLGKQQEDGTFKGTPLFSGVSYGDLSVKSLKFEGAEKTVTVSVEIFSGEHVLWKGSIAVRPLNGVTIT